MASIEVRRFESPDETRPFEGKGQMRLVTVGGKALGKAEFEPGWRWSANVKPIAGTDSCQVTHLIYVLSGRMRVTMNDGGSAEIGPGDVVSIPPGHDAEVIGDETCVTLDLGEEEADYAKRS